jgi:hypothetical protein
MRYLIAVVIFATLAIVWQPSTQLLFWENKAAFQELEQTDNINSRKVKTETTLETHNQNNEHETITEDFIPNPEAIASMRKARLEGDPRAPALGKYHQRDLPTEEELNDHELYLEYERRQEKRVYRAYVEASKIKTSQLRAMIAKGKAAGISEEDIAFAEEKISGIENMALTLQQDYPDIMEDSYEPPADWLIESLGKDDNLVESE